MMLQSPDFVCLLEFCFCCTRRYLEDSKHQSIACFGLNLHLVDRRTWCLSPLCWLDRGEEIEIVVKGNKLELRRELCIQVLCGRGRISPRRCLLILYNISYCQRNVHNICAVRSRLGGKRCSESILTGSRRFTYRPRVRLRPCFGANLFLALFESLKNSRDLYIE